MRGVPAVKQTVAPASERSHKTAANGHKIFSFPYAGLGRAFQAVAGADMWHGNGSLQLKDMFRDI